MISRVTHGSMSIEEILWDIPLSFGRQLIGVWYRFYVPRTDEVGIDIRLVHPVQYWRNADPLGGWQK